MPKGRIELENGASISYDDVEEKDGFTVYKEAYTHGVRAIRSSEVKLVDKHEWHRTPFGHCESLSSSEVSNAVDRAKGNKK